MTFFETDYTLFLNTTKEAQTSYYDILLWEAGLRGFRRNRGVGVRLKPASAPSPHPFYKPGDLKCATGRMTEKDTPVTVSGRALQHTRQWASAPRSEPCFLGKASPSPTQLKKNASPENSYS